MSETNAVVIGAGIAGASVAYFLSQEGFAVTVVDAGVHAASHVPSALINPVRGQSGQVDAKAIEGMHFTWNLIRELTAQGFNIPHGQDGVLRPIPDNKTRAKFERNLPAELKTEWLSPTESPEPLSPGWAHVLRLPEAGWVDGPALCQALLKASQAELVRGQAWDYLLEAKTSGDPIEKHVSCIVSDIEMPLMDGHRLTKLVKEDSVLKQIPVILFSSLISEEIHVKGKALGADEQITKPEIANLVSIIDRLTEK